MPDEPEDTGASEDDTDDKYKTPLDGFANVELGGLPPIAPDGGFMPGPVGLSIVVPPATPNTFVCLRGPCRHYFQIETFFASGNPKDTWDPVDGLKDAEGMPIRQPNAISRSCLVHPGTETELTDDNVFSCNKWFPMTARELKKRDKVRRAYLKRNPQFVPVGEVKRRWP